MIHEHCSPSSFSSLLKKLVEKKKKKKSQEKKPINRKESIHEKYGRAFTQRLKC